MTESLLYGLRKSRGLTQHTLAELCSVDKSVISRAERLNHPPSLDLQIRLAIAFGLTLSELQASCGWPVTVIPGMGIAVNG